MKRVYLDYNASAPLRPVAKEAMMAVWDALGNPSSVHHAGRHLRSLLERARQQVSKALAALPSQVTFVSGGSEGNNLALQGVQGAIKTFLISAVEHDSVRSVLPSVTIRVTAQGVVDLEHLEERLAHADHPALVSVMLANNETGVIQPLQEVVALARRYGALVHTDAVQAVGRMPLSFADLGVDMMTVSSHKLGGPVGAGALIMREKLPFYSVIRGGGQEYGRRAGTENTSAIVGFAAALDEAVGEDWTAVDILRNQLENRLRAVAPEAKLYGAEQKRLPNTTCFGVRGLRNEFQVMALDLAGVCVSAGSACSSSKLRPSHVLLAMGEEEEAASSALRVSLSVATREQDIAAFCTAWEAIYQQKYSTSQPMAVNA